MMMNPSEWWDKGVDQKAATERLTQAGLPLVGWVNRVPVFAPGALIDWEQVEELCLSDGPPPPRAEILESAPARPKRKRRKG